ncbi:STAS/SEC14 domain-containing protein [Verrucomicrobiaceae bacterium N1E253]|uniref:STAS/SEC14 domain-containing protein n=1 Tax=Oceaniferula marina TaxID=2748318 RepID=A0A851GJ26_9BACT|nr:STAS/SEC14 domain-containing protein [Oceaniferula marina]NWK54660.1 STAS/SEC14 domain-containing protein [Oceaniferula marina]
MITRIPNLPDHVLGFKATGKVTGTDYESSIIPAVNAALQRHKKISLIYHIPEPFEGFDLAAAWDDTKLGLKHFNHWKRIAVVSDIPWIHTGVKAVGFFFPCEMRIFADADLDAATQWASEAES